MEISFFPVFSFFPEISGARKIALVYFFISSSSIIIDIVPDSTRKGNEIRDIQIR